MFRSSTIIRELELNLAKVIFMLKDSVKLRRYLLCGCVAACRGIACVLHAAHYVISKSLSQIISSRDRHIVFPDRRKFKICPFGYPPMAFIFSAIKAGKSVPLQAWSSPEGSRKLRFPDFMTKTQGGGKVVSLTHRRHLPPGNPAGIHFC